MKNSEMEKIINFCKQYGFIYQGSEIYGGLANTWDFGILGSKMVNNIKQAWRKRFIDEKLNSFEIDSSILLNPRIWEASGHANSFSDPKIDCKKCKKRYRADKLIEDFTNDVIPDLMTNEEINEYIKKNIKCPNCGSSNYTDVREFDLMFKTFRGTINEEKKEIYLRPETCQGIYVNFLNVLRTSRCKLPMTICQIGKVFRNEVTPGNFLFRTIEFEQLELQTFCKPGEDEKIYEYNKEQTMKFLTDLGVNKDNLRFKDHDKLTFYAHAATDIQYKFPTGFDELWGIHNRSDYDLKQHSKFSGQNLNYLDPDTNEKYTPYILETSVGCGRMFLTLICDAYTNEVLEDKTTREVLKVHPFIAPYKVAILPLLKKKHSEKSKELYNQLCTEFSCTYDDTGNIGKRYRRQDAIGTPFCITIDDNTLNDNTVTIRDRDTMKQTTININDIKDYISSKINFK